jgi:hypothetical protein
MNVEPSEEPVKRANQICWLTAGKNPSVIRP